MPRTVNPTHARQWAELALQGLTVAEIRKKHRDRTGKVVDSRTIERALKKTKAEIAERAASAAELQHAIREHSKHLLAGIDPLTKAIKSTTTGRLNPLPLYAVTVNKVAIGSVTAELAGSSWRVRIPSEESIELRLLKEHLPSDKMWKQLDKFSDSVAHWIAMRTRFAAQIQIELAAGPGAPESVDEPFEMAGLSRIETAAANDRIKSDHSVDEVLRDLVIDPDQGGIWLGSTKLTSLSFDDVDDLRTMISAKVRGVSVSDVGRDILTSWTALTRASSGLLEELAMLRMVTYLPGTCKSCKRFRL
ncbi:hypothetical protein [Candidatus Lucifugimonas marina]|jgi:hypothetical protein|uniref:Uncharacterized protein n=1 Tax=Candidatus Lucifugimonas marina TaxID=3038979 RepID=A0AAJ5ZLR5_9CHLR|nr:hypothetical protein [SAR202 cluster bacterium JH702]MDG0870686.1 hypothetical protein [SAR202 cluster bacterium JH639]WFG36630.1 hypothetical protein GKN94_13410 [SAR202 cluster bacterium JH545]WFG40563.1 hypothetical protein GKO48_13450 [SAR202 cluster bacterium JH1073]